MIGHSLFNKVGANGKKVIKNSIYSMLGSVLGQIIALCTYLAMGRMLGVSGLGSYTFAITFSGLVYLFLNLGLGGILQRDISQHSESASKIYANSLGMRFFFSLPASLVIGTIAAFVIRRSGDLVMILLACIYTGLTGIFSLALDGITAKENFRISFIYNILQKLLCFIATVLALCFTRSMLAMLLYNNIVFAVLIVGELLYVNRTQYKVYLEIDPAFCRSLLKQSLPTIFGAAAEYLSLKSDVLVLSLMLNDTATGLYSVSSNIYIAASLVPLAMAKAATPTFNRMLAYREDVHNLVRKTFSMMILSSIALIIGIFLLGRFGIVLLWGKGFEPATTSLKILSVSLLFMPCNRFLEDMLTGFRKQAYTAICSVVGAVFNIVTNILLVPIIGMNAVAITTVITEFIVMALELIMFRKMMHSVDKYEVV